MNVDGEVGRSTIEAPHAISSNDQGGEIGDRCAPRAGGSGGGADVVVVEGIEP
jgi:hypothetical protein